MPLVRFEVRNEYGLGAQQLYKDGVQSEDPKAVLDGVAVAALVGLLRQLGDLAQFAAEVFHGLQEQVGSTASRSRKLVTRVRQVEASLPSLEKAVLSQTSHIHFAYTPGTEWHACIRNEQNHFIYDDLPHFIMDSYEECREPPRLQLLDRFDTGGPGSCLKRYSDPTFFRRASVSSEVCTSEKSQQKRKARKIKRRRSRQWTGHFQNGAPVLNGSSRMQLSSTTGQGQSSLSKTGSTFDRNFKSDHGDQSESLASKDGVDVIDCVFRPSASIQPDEPKTIESAVTEGKANNKESIYIDEQTAVADDDIQRNRTTKTTVPRSSSITWDEKLEIVEPMGVNYGIEDIEDVSETNFYIHEQDLKPVNTKGVNQVDDFSEHGSTPKSNADGRHLRATIDGNSMELIGLDFGIDEFQDLLETNFDLHEHDLDQANLKSFTQVVDFCEGAKTLESTADGNLINDPTDKMLGTGEVKYFLEANVDVAEREPDEINPEHVSEEETISEGGNKVKVIKSNQRGPETINAEHVSQEDNFSEGGNNVKVVEWNQGEPEKINAEDVSLVDTFSEGGHNVKVIEWNQRELEIINAEHVSRVNTFSEDENNVKTIEWDQRELESLNAEHLGQVDTFSGSRNNLQVIEWNQLDNIETETDNFVDALNTIESESESDFETQMKKEVQVSASKDEMVENTMTDQMAEIISHLEPKHECHSICYDHKEGVLDDPEHSDAPLSAANMVSPQSAPPSHNESEAAAGQDKDDSACLSDEWFVQMNQSSSLSNVSQGIDSCVNDAEIRMEPEVCELETSSSQAPNDQRTVCEPHESQEMPFGSSNTYPFAFWSNGSLLGLEPSKPTVFNMSNSANPAPKSSGNVSTIDQCSSNAMHKVDGPAGTPASSVSNSECDNKLDNYDQDVGSSKHLSQISEETLDKSLNRDNSMPHESKAPVGFDVRNTSSETTSTSEDRSSLLSMLGRGLLKNGLLRSGSSGYDEKHKISSPLETNEFGNGCHATVSHWMPEINSKGKVNSPVTSPPPSPPLEHMKISFRPVDVFGTSRLKLKYQEGAEHHESTEDTFPSFQLVPQCTKLQHDIGSESDEDTFCQSLACMSDDRISHLSDSNSELWDFGDSSERNDQALYDGLCRISSTEPASTSPQHEERNHGRVHVGSISVGDSHSLFGASFGVPIWDTKNPFAYEEMKLCLNPEVDSSHLQELTPEPPPLPPLLWRVSKPLLDAMEGKQHPGSDSLNQSFVPELSEPAISHAATVFSGTQESATITKSNKVEKQKLDRQKQIHHAENGRGADDEGDFLHQIRTKSFNLKCTETTRSIHTPAPATRNKITAILQKANAIRQAVGSDDGEDDSWSDT